jgi:hypothetical protein
MKQNIRMKATDSRRFEQLEKYIWRHFTPYSYVSDYDDETHEVSLGIQIQEIIQDRGSDGSTIKMVELDDIVSCKWSMLNGRVKVTGLTRSYFAGQVKRQYANILQRSQNALLPSLYTRLVKIPQVSHAMSPLERIIAKIHYDGRISAEQLRANIFKPATVQKYFTLLADLDIVSREDGHYVAGPRMKILEGEEDSEELYVTILGEVLQKRLKYMKEILHWTMIGSYLQWSNAYYFPAYEAERLIKTEKQDLIDVYRRLYQQGYDTDQLFQLRKVVSANIIRSKDNYYVGEEDIFNGYKETANKEKILEPVYMPVAK